MLPNWTTVPTRAWYTAKISLRKFEVKKYLDTWNIAPRSEEERIEEFLEENDVLLKNQDKIPFKYISDIHYGKKTVWKNPDFEN